MPDAALEMITRFGEQDNELTVGGRRLTDLVAETGTPAYFYSRDLLGQRIRKLRATLPSAISLHYAVKANPMGDLLAFLADRVDGFDVASGGELDRALSAGGRPETISFAGPGKTDAELEAAVAAGVAINAESETEILRIARIGQAQETRPRVAVRVNPDFELKSSGMRMGGGAKPFGIDAERVPAALELIDELPLDFEGLHIFAGSQNLDTEAICTAQTEIFALAKRLLAGRQTGRLLNIGGGLGIPYFPGESPVDLPHIGEHLKSLLVTHRDWLGDTRVAMELGRFIVGEAGIYVTRVVDRKESRGEVFLLTDGGMHHHLALSGNLGQVIRKNYPLAIGNRLRSPVTETVNIHGPLCTPLDVLGNKIELPAAGPGDLVVVFQSGAYGLTASPQQFLSHPAPAERLV